MNEADRQATRVQAMLCRAIRSATAIKINYGFTRKPTVRDVAKIERALNGWIVETLREFWGVKLSKRQHVFGIDLSTAQWLDDGKHDLTISLDFGEMLPVLTGMSRDVYLHLYREMEDFQRPRFEGKEESRG